MKKVIGIIVIIVIIIIVGFGIFGNTPNNDVKTNKSQFKGYQVEISGTTWHVIIVSNKTFSDYGSGSKTFNIGPANNVHVTANKKSPSTANTTAPLDVSILKDGKVVNSSSGYNKYATVILSYKE
ncbi:hypothetical protein [Methanobrevibacter filiformis]|uniref:Uncharacterized protein n=1 Tax=Methanobrevibacter filiformis TaxID=55758 RepID=A0A166DAJ9_9EURY|nr:hypothetical protein [Methanobrevibacter filiformis]KZX15382.1 hypothetical protein MBFIL_06830 [Methanobrevibacter filiformis]